MKFKRPSTITGPRTKKNTDCVLAGKEPTSVKRLPGVEDRNPRIKMEHGYEAQGPGYKPNAVHSAQAKMQWLIVTCKVQMEILV